MTGLLRWDFKIPTISTFQNLRKFHPYLLSVRPMMPNLYKIWPIIDVLFTFYLKIYILLGENTSPKSKIYTHRYLSVAKIFKIYPFSAEHPRQHLVLSYPPGRHTCTLEMKNSPQIFSNLQLKR